MKAVRTHGRGGPEQIFFEDAPLPEVRRGDVLVQVRATGITPAELTWDETYQNPDGAPRIPSILGHEVSGRQSSDGVGARSVGGRRVAGDGRPDRFAGRREGGG